jgi:hypothetical protein
MALISGSKGFPVKQHVCAGSLSISKQSFFCLFKTVNSKSMSVPPGPAQKQLIYLISKLQESRLCLFCPPLRKFTFLFSSVQMTFIWKNVRAFGLSSKLDLARVCLSCLFLSGSISFLSKSG